MRAVWAGERRGIAGRIGPAPTRQNGPPIILGGHSRRALARATLLADGWISGGGGPDGFRAGATAVLSAWAQAQRPGRPRLMALVYFALGEDAAETARAYLTGYYGFAPPVAQAVIRGTPVDAQSVSDTITVYQAAGCDEIIFVPCSADAAQIAGLREAVTLASAPLVGAASCRRKLNTDPSVATEI
jgi:alkanesulfonate monooxygenase SsuD/methylene tetrahydromethanopterin reductase-like flavin-dependent oxidoreductase (luciferase family)